MEYVNRVRNFFTPFFSKRVKESTTHACALTITDSEVSLLHVNYTQNRYEVHIAEKIRFADDKDSLHLVLAGVVQRNDLETIPTTWLLEPDDYQLFLIESMPVHPDEFRDALQWRLRSLLNYPIEDSIVDYFMLPANKITPQHPMIAAIAAKRVQLQKTIEILKKCQVNLLKIDVPEIAMHNLTATLETDEKSTAFIYFYPHIAILNITREKTIYFTRRINLSSDNILDKKNIEDLSLDILRYFDYFQSQWRFPSPTRVFIGTKMGNTQELIQAFSDYVLAKTEAFSIEPLILNKSLVSKVNNEFLLSLGSLLKGNK